MNNRVTIKDVARAAGVSVATVSYVLNDKKNQKISEETKKKVLQIVNLMGYSPNQNARALANKNNQNICLITRNTDNLFYRSEIFVFMKSLSAFLEENNFKLNIVGWKIPDSLNDFNVLIALDLKRKEFLDIGDKTLTPLIALNSYIDDPVFYQLNYDYKSINEAAKMHFKESFTFYTIDTNNIERKNFIKKIFASVVFVNNLNQVTKANDKNILVIESTLYNLINTNCNVFYYKIDKFKEFDTILQAINLINKRTHTDKHNILIK